MLNLGQAKKQGGEKMEMKTTARIIADVDPSVKKKLKEISKATDIPMTHILITLIEREYKKVCK